MTEMLYDAAVKLDRVVQAWVSQHHNAFLDNFFVWLTSLGGVSMLISLSILVILLLLLKRDRIAGLMFAVTMFSSWTIMHSLKILFMRPRPSGEHLVYAAGYSFPSGHAMLSLVFYGFLVYLVYPRISRTAGRMTIILAGTIILLVGASRVYLNVHYVSDVLGGYLFGTLCLMGFAIIYQKLKIRLGQ